MAENEVLLEDFVDKFAGFLKEQLQEDRKWEGQ
jgi:hypothetical protein